MGRIIFAREFFHWDENERFHSERNQQTESGKMGNIVVTIEKDGKKKDYSIKGNNAPMFLSFYERLKIFSKHNLPNAEEMEELCKKYGWQDVKGYSESLLSFNALSKIEKCSLDGKGNGYVVLYKMRYI